MLNPGVLISAWVTKLRAIADLVTEMGGDATRIQGYYGENPTNTSLLRAVHKMEAPAVLVAYRGFGPARSRSGEFWEHRFSVFFQFKQTDLGDADTEHYKALWLFVNGVPAGQSQRLINATIHASCQPMTAPSGERMSLVIADTGTTFDYWEVRTSLMEIGDN